jgi:AcrR family transcriptional regulator
MNTDRRDAKVSVLLDAAREVVMRFGYRKTTLEDIADAAGVSRATLYYYFPNKEEVFRALIEREINAFQQILTDAVDPDAPPDERLMALVRTRYTHLRRIKALYSVTHNISREHLPMALQALGGLEEAERALVAGLLGEGIASGRFRPVDVDLLAAAILAALRGLDEQFVFEEAEALPEGAETLFHTLLHGLLA